MNWNVHDYGRDVRGIDSNYHDGLSDLGYKPTHVLEQRARRHLGNEMVEGMSDKEIVDFLLSI